MLSYYALKQHRLLLNHDCLKISDERKQTRLWLLQHRRELNMDNLNNIRYEASRYFRNKTENKR
jgi:hypothetical protein